MEGMRDQLGLFPEPGDTARTKQLFYRLTEEDSIRMISGEKTPALISAWASNDVVQFGTVKLLSGGAVPQQTEYDSHPGDAVFYALEGPLTFFCPDSGETFHVETGEYMYLPENTRYKIINYYGHSVKAIFAIAPTF